MAPQFRRILCPVDFDDNSMQALDTAANLARESNGTVFVLHVTQKGHDTRAFAAISRL